MRISIFGDSISTWEGITPARYEVWYDPATADLYGLESSHETWWMRVIQGLDGTLCANDAFSGCTVSGPAFPCAWCPERTSNLGDQAGSPDLILVYLGLNDFGFGRPDRSSYDGEPCDPTYFYDAYALMLRALRRNYPDARIVCGTIMRTHTLGRSLWSLESENTVGVPLAHYNESIRQACQREGALVADLAHSWQTYETLDSVHPTARGHETLSVEWLEALAHLGIS